MTRLSNLPKATQPVSGTDEIPVLAVWAPGINWYAPYATTSMTDTQPSFENNLNERYAKRLQRQNVMRYHVN